MFYEKIGAGVDKWLLDWRQKGMNGTQEEREAFLKTCFHAARGNMRVVLVALPFVAPGKDKKEFFDEVTKNVLTHVAKEGKDSGFDEEQTAAYVEAHRAAYDSLAEEMGLK